MIKYEYNGNTYDIIPLVEMKNGKVYEGFCRNAQYAYWNGKQFLHIRHKFGNKFIEEINHPENEYHFDVFMVQQLADTNLKDVKDLLEMLSIEHLSGQRTGLQNQ